MAFSGIRLENTLEGTSNFVAWKDCMEAVLDENGFLEYIKSGVEKSQAYDAQNLAKWKKYVAKVRRIILEGVWDHIVSVIHRKETSFAKLKALI